MRAPQLPSAERSLGTERSFGTSQRTAVADRKPAQLAASAEVIARGSSDLRDLVHGGHDAIRLAADAAGDDVDVTLQAAPGGTRVLQLRFGDGRGRRGPR